MRFGSVCSGIEAASVAWTPLGWEAAWFSEIEPFPSAVLSHHYPDVVNRGDMTNFQEWDNEPIDLLCGGTPCQSFSVAGLRKGLDDPRGNLMLTYLAIAAKYRPRWLVWENVPGVLSSNGGKDFGTFLGGLGELGYGFAYRVLDAQYFGVAQRRKRVFVVGYLGDWRPPAAVLFERHSLSGNPAPSREAGQAITPTVTGGAPFSRTGNERVEASAVVAMASGQGGAETVDGYTPTLTCVHEAPIVHYRKSRRAQSTTDHETWVEDDVSNTLNCFDVGDIRSTDVVAQPVGFTRCDHGGDAVVDGTPTMRCGSNYSAHLAVAFGGDIARTLQARHDSSPCADRGMDVIASAMQVRRLTPVECERLQGFPDNYTNIPWRKASESPDGPRYKALGNSWAVPVVRWIGERIKMIEGMQ